MNPDVAWRDYYELVRGFLDAMSAPMNPRFNVAPSQDVLVLRWQDGTLGVELAKWGFRPKWLKDPSKAQINARSETVAEKPMFRSAFRQARCAVPGDGWYEWMRAGVAKQPYFFHLKDNEPFMFAGIWTAWSDDAGEHATFALLTTSPNTLAARVHDRMPVILRGDQVDAWIDLGTSPDQVQSLCAPYAGDDLEIEPVSTRINRPAHDDEECVAPIGPKLAKGDA